MSITVASTQLMDLGFDQETAEHLIKQIDHYSKREMTPAETWQSLSKNVLSGYPFKIHLLFFNLLFPDRHEHPDTAPGWLPETDRTASANIFKFMSALNIQEVTSFHRWSTTHYQDFWQRVIETLSIVFSKAPDRICDLSQGNPAWFPGAKLNIADSCFNAAAVATAIVYEDKQKKCRKLTYGELNKLSNRVANSLVRLGFTAGDAIGIAMPMNLYAIAIYLGIIKMGGTVVSIADSFSSQEIASRLRIANAKAVFTQDINLWAGKKLPLYAKVRDASELAAIVLPCEQSFLSPDEKSAASDITLRETDYFWHDFLVAEADFTSVPRDPMTPCNILFSSGTTAEPKAIVWNQTTPIKAASDAFFHQNIHPNDVLTWPTNLGWMMGPWLIFAALVNQAAIAVYPDAPKDRAFGEFVQNAHVTMLGVVPTLVSTWRQAQCMEKLDWRALKTFSSTGECSNADDMLYLMSLAGYQPVIEYCGGTEIGGGYLSSTVIQENYPSLFSTPAMGLNITILDEEGHPASSGEVAIIPPSIGLSTQLLNADHFQVYFANMPKAADGTPLRRHGDQICRLPNGYYCILGRADDSMNLGGIKISSAEIERVLAGLPGIVETAAIAISPPDKGPSLLVVYAVTTMALEKAAVTKEMQKRISAYLNPLFKIHDVVLVNELPKTASNKIMRRVLRDKYSHFKTS